MFKIGVREVGERQLRRWIIHNSLQPEQYWNGKNWTDNGRRALLYQDRNQAYHQAKREN